MTDDERDEIKRWKFIAALTLIFAEKNNISPYELFNSVLNDFKEGDSSTTNEDFFFIMPFNPIVSRVNGIRKVTNDE